LLKHGTTYQQLASTMRRLRMKPLWAARKIVRVNNQIVENNESLEGIASGKDFGQDG
jgi:hypothetical protein